MRSYSLLAMMLCAALIVRCAEFAHSDDKKEPVKTEKKDDKKDDKKDEKESALFVVPRPGGKEVKIVDWSFSQGTRSFDLSKNGASGPKSKTGPQYLEFREEKSTSWEKGILTLVPLSSIRKMEYDRDKKSVAVTVATAGDKDEVLTGTTKYTGVNKITIEGEAILPGIGAASQTFQGGSPDGVHSVRFPNPKPVEAVKGSSAVIIADDKIQHTAHELQPLWLVDGEYRVLPYLMFKKTVKVELDKIAKLRVIPPANKKQVSHEYEVTLRDGNEHTLTLLSKIEQEQKEMVFVGMVGRVPVGFKVFPPHTIAELRLVMDEEKK